MNVRALFLLAALPLVGCASTTSEPVASDSDELTASPAPGAKIIGTNDLTPVKQDGANIPAKYAGLIDAFGEIGPMGCTGTHIGDGLVITAGHCFGAPSTRKNDTPCTGKTVKWGVRVDKASYLTSQCQTILAMEQNSSRDYAIFKVSPAPTAKVAVDLTARPEVGTTITIFSHPSIRPLEWSKTCTVQPATSGGWGIDQFSHQCDTEPGSSGATVLDDTSLKVVGIHDGGIAPWNYATFLFNTPLAELLPAPVVQTPPTTQTPPTDTTDPLQGLDGEGI